MPGVTTVRLQDDVEDNLDQLAARLQRSKSWVINQALREFIGRAQDDASRWQDTLQALESVAQGRVVDGAAVHDWMRTWGSEEESAAPTPPR